MKSRTGAVKKEKRQGGAPTQIRGLSPVGADGHRRFPRPLSPVNLFFLRSHGVSPKVPQQVSTLPSSPFPGSAPSIDGKLIYKAVPGGKGEWKLVHQTGGILNFGGKVFLRGASSIFGDPRVRYLKIYVPASRPHTIRHVGTIYLSPGRPTHGFGFPNGSTYLILARFNLTRTVLHLLFFRKTRGLADILFIRFLDGKL